MCIFVYGKLKNKRHMKHLLVVICLFSCGLFAYSQQEVINLPAPVKSGGKPLMDVLSERKSYHGGFVDKDLDNHHYQTYYGLLMDLTGLKNVLCHQPVMLKSSIFTFC